MRITLTVLVAAIVMITFEVTRSGRPCLRQRLRTSKL